MKHAFSQRILKVEELIFRKLDSLRYNNPDLIDLSRGVPMGLPPREVLYELTLRLKYAANHVYTEERGLKELREEIAYFYKDKYNIDLDPDTEVQVLMGAKEGISNLIQACVNPGERVLLPDPAFPVFVNSVLFADGEPVLVPLRWENDYVPEKSDLTSRVNGKEKLMFVNYPHNPTGAVCSLDDFKMFSDFAYENNIILCYDAVYRELSFSKHPTLLQVEGAKEHCVELASLSKTFDMCGWRIAYMVGNRDIISQVRKVKSVFDVGQFVPIQFAAALALKMVSYIEEVSRMYKNRAEKIFNIMKELGFDVFEPKGAFFVWSRLPEGFNSSQDYIYDLYNKHNLLLMPGRGFGKNGEGFFRISLTPSMEKILEGLSRIEKFDKHYGVSNENYRPEIRR